MILPIGMTSGSLFIGKPKAPFLAQLTIYGAPSFIAFEIASSATLMLLKVVAA
jgi:hypothetical protein